MTTFDDIAIMRADLAAQRATLSANLATIYANIETLSRRTIWSRLRARWASTQKKRVIGR
ncbi:hypothetical protein [Tsukamurella tyrosinosolvens]|uniref:hypothetical protein n=1 Tax=Tsukamurella tyrosinosolvens TaxID=57704 RepID=UPI003F4A6461